jgi:hypothetical protein
MSVVSHALGRFSRQSQRQLPAGALDFTREMASRPSDGCSVASALLGTTPGERQQ